MQRFFDYLLVLTTIWVIFCLTACGTDNDSDVPEDTEYSIPPTISPAVQEITEDAYLTPIKFPDCRWQEDIDLDNAEGEGYPTAHESLTALNDLYYNVFVLVDPNSETVTWQVNDASGTLAGKITAHRFDWGLWGVERIEFCLPRQIVAKLNLG